MGLLPPPESTLRQSPLTFWHTANMNVAALALARTIASTWDEAHALAGLGRCAQAARRTADARAFLRQAQEAFREVDADEAAAIAAELSGLAEAE